jgi:ESCRT-I complex subunit VPS37
LIATNKSLAEYNLSREPTYHQSRQQLIDGHNELKAIKEEVDKKKSRLSELSRQTSIDTTLALMQTSAAQAEEESEDIATAFLAQEMSFDSFIKDFIEKRKLSHLRRIKTEKMIECIRSEANNRVNNNTNVNNNTSNMFQPLRPAPPPPSLPFAAASNPGMGSNSAPYPVYQMMPQMPPQPQQPQQPFNYPYNRTPYR